MSSQSHIIVLGAGLIGLSTADSLCARGAKVTVIEARSGPCEGTSFANSGMIHPSQARGGSVRNSDEDDVELDAARVTVKLAKRSATLLHTRMAQLGLPARPAGCLKIFESLAAAKSARDDYGLIGIKADIVIDPPDSFGHPACVFPGDGSGNARDFGCALAADLVARGVGFYYGVENFEARQTEFGFTVTAGKDQLRCDHLVLAAGISTPEVLAQFDLQMTLDSVAGAAANFAWPAHSDDLPTRPVMDAASNSALTVFDDHVRISGGWHVREIAPLLSRWTEIAPELIGRLGEPRAQWTSNRPVSPVGRPYISQTAIDGLWVNTGHGHMGWTLCAGSAELLTEMILDGRADVDFCL